MHKIIHFWNQRQILRRLVYNIAYFENLKKILRLAGGQITMAPSAMKMTSKNHQKKSLCVLYQGAQICAFPTQNSKKVPLWNTLTHNKAWVEPRIRFSVPSVPSVEIEPMNPLTLEKRVKVVIVRTLVLHTVCLSIASPHWTLWTSSIEVLQLRRYS